MYYLCVYNIEYYTILNYIIVKPLIIIRLGRNNTSNYQVSHDVCLVTEYYMRHDVIA